MKAIIISRPGGPDVLEMQDRPNPEPGVGQIRVRVRASALNRADLLQRQGNYPVPPGASADISGMEYEGEAIPVPRALSWEDAAAIPEAFLTAYDALFRQLDVRMGETVLIHAVASGVGTAGLQVARASGATVVGTSRSASKLERAKAMGLDVAIDTSGGSWAEK